MPGLTGCVDPRGSKMSGDELGMAECPSLRSDFRDGLHKSNAWCWWQGALPYNPPRSCRIGKKINVLGDPGHT